MYNLSVKGQFLYNDNKPFFLLGDTAWLILYKLDLKEIERYLRNRKSLGFNYVQIVLVYSAGNMHDINEMDHQRINPNDNTLWDKAIAFMELALKYDIIVGLLPCWGAVVKEGFVNEGNALEYATFLANRFKKYHNLIWVLGGDVRGDVSFETFNILGSTLKKLTKNLITFHPFGRTGSYLWFNDCSWLDFNMFQSGHRRYDQLNLNSWDDTNLNEDTFGEDSYKYVIKNNSYLIKKPVIDAEPSYEGIVQGLHDPKEPYWEARHVRRYAYWSVFEGAFGFIYGNNAIIQFYNYDSKGSYGVRESWYEGLTSPGGAEMQYLLELMNEFDYTKGISKPTIIKNNKSFHHKTAVLAANEYILIYTYLGDKLIIDLSDYKDKKLDIYVMNPENNSKAYYDTVEGISEYTFRPTRRREISNDWVIIFKVV